MKKIKVTLHGDESHIYTGRLFAHLSTHGVLCIKSIETGEVMRAFAEGIWTQVEVLEGAE